MKRKSNSQFPKLLFNNIYDTRQKELFSSYSEFISVLISVGNYIKKCRSNACPGGTYNLKVERE